ncbi:MAG: MBL fold metallo-hydrolase [Gammaproteobacteria bacterium]|nr:MBL fold metallo-hydrolase [Gammaproteobacteria bacterium]
MESHVLSKNNSSTWFMFGRDPGKSADIIDTNQYMVRTKKSAFLMDPGGIELFSTMFAMILRYAPADEIHHIFASHQDPDIISSLGLWDQAVPDAKLYSPWLWESFIKHFGMKNMEYVGIPDQGMTVNVDGLPLELIPAHYLHSAGNFNVYDPAHKVLMSGDIGAALEEPCAPIFVDDFDEHIPKMRAFHQRWMPSNQAKLRWVERVRSLDIEFLCPQHGRIFKGENVKRFIDWFEQLQVGVTQN